MAKYMRLDEVCLINMGQSPDSKSYNENGEGLPFFQGNADFGALYPTVRMWCNNPAKVVDSGTLLISVRAPIGALNFSTEKSCIGRGLAGITPYENVDIKYIYYCLKGKLSELAAKGTGSTFKAISKNALAETSVKVIPLSEQKTIVETMKKASSIINNHQQQLSALDTFIKARFVEMLGEPETNVKDWPVVPLSAVCSISSSKRIYQSEQSTNGVPFWRVSDLTNQINAGSVNADLFIPKERYSELKERGQVPLPGDILLTSRGTLGQCYIVKDSDRFYFQDGMISWLSKYKSDITPLFIAQLFTMPGFRKQIDSLQAGSTVSYLSIAMIKRLKAMIPDMKTQQEFAAFVAQVDKSKFVLEKM